ncbi:MAG: carboxypeptidase regulatory-like domain-containing protein [Myxococcales bacterium]|nr:carboxypeptidase regulatory-like domain-containing protein [Myxococcales bacterium]
MRRWILATALACAATGTAVAAPPAGSITGAVTWTGPAPEAKPVDRSSDPVCAKTAHGTDDVVVTDGKLRDVLVRIKVGGAPAAAAPTTPAVIAQSECMYAPRVVGVIAGQALEIRNLDATFHNVRGNALTKVLWNLAQPKGAAPIVRDLAGRAAGDVVSLHCDVHPWMAAWVVVSDHGFFAVTGADGGFTLPGVPPGSYTVEAWHPTLGLKTAKVKVKKGKPTKVRFTFAAPPAAAPAP